MRVTDHELDAAETTFSQAWRNSPQKAASSESPLAPPVAIMTARPPTRPPTRTSRRWRHRARMQWPARRDSRRARKAFISSSNAAQIFGTLDVEIPASTPRAEAGSTTFLVEMPWTLAPS